MRRFTYRTLWLFVWLGFARNLIHVNLVIYQMQPQNSANNMLIKHQTTNLKHLKNSNQVFFASDKSVSAIHDLVQLWMEHCGGRLVGRYFLHFQATIFIVKLSSQWEPMLKWATSSRGRKCWPCSSFACWTSWISSIATLCLV